MYSIDFYKFLFKRRSQRLECAIKWGKKWVVLLKMPVLMCVWWVSTIQSSWHLIALFNELAIEENHLCFWITLECKMTEIKRLGLNFSADNVLEYRFRRAKLQSMSSTYYIRWFWLDCSWSNLIHLINNKWNWIWIVYLLFYGVYTRPIYETVQCLYKT